MQRMQEFSSSSSWHGRMVVALSCLCLLSLAAGLFAPDVLAQVYSGSLTGVITDPSGAVVPGAKVKLTDVDKGFTYDAETDSEGRYLLRSLPPSNYRLSVSLSGFKTHVQEGITLNVSQNATVNVALQLGAETQTVDVVEATPILSTQDAVTGQELNRTYINDLPLVGRQIFDLAYLSPGITEAAQNVGGPDNNFVSNGGRNATADILLDGVSTTNIEQNSGIQVPLYTPSVDAVQEFKVQQSNFSAEIGFSGATVINVITRSGTNAFHGSAYEFLRNDALNANNFFNNRSGIEKAPRRYNLFGGTIGGPIRKDRTFFFFDYEGVRDREAETRLGGVPSSAMRAGNFGEICHDGFDASGLCGDPEGQIWDPYSGEPNDDDGYIRDRFVPFNRLDLHQSPGHPDLAGTPFQLPARPGNLIDPVAFKMMQFYPLPNIPGGDQFENWIFSGSSPSRNDQFDIKIDHSFGANDRISGKYAFTRSSNEPLKCFSNPGDPCDGGKDRTPAHLFSVNWVHTFNPKTLLNFTYGVTRQLIDSHNSLEGYPDYDIVRDLGLPAYMLRSGVPQLPEITLENYQGVGTQSWSFYRNGNETHHLLTSLSRIQGRHDLKFGYDGRMHRQNSLFPGVPGGVFAFTKAGTAQTAWSGGGGDDLASFLMGAGTGGAWGEYQVPVTPAAQSFQHAGFVQDNWRVTDRLTLNLGLRYDLDLSRTERFNRMSHFDPEVTSPLAAQTGLNLRGGIQFASSSDRAVYGSDTNNLGPRFGFAYKLTENTVMRGGYGLFYAPSRRGAAGPDAMGWWGFDAYTTWLPTFQNAEFIPGARLSDPFPITGPDLPPGSSKGLLTSVGGTFRAPVRSITTTPNEQTWSFGFQRELPGNIVIDTNYVGKKGTNLYFANAGQVNHLGPDVESMPRDGIIALNDFVPNPFAGVITSGELSGPEVRAYQLQLPFPHFTNFNADDRPVANSIYHALQFRAEKRFSNGLQFLGTYTWSKSIDDSSVASGDTAWLGGATSLQNPNKRFLERSVSQFDIPHVFQFSWVYDLPIGRGKALGTDWNPVVSGIFGGWKFSGSWRMGSGQPIGLTLADGVSQGVPTYGAQRPNLAGRLEGNTGPDFVGSYFANPEVIEVPDDFTVGNAPRALDSVRAPGTNLANLGLFKQVPLGSLREGARLEYRVEFFNAFNRTHFRAPDTTFEGGSFGRISELLRGPREIQMALKFYW